MKQVWELSRHHHLTVLAAAYALTGDRRYAERAGSHRRSWWQENPFLSGIHWTSGIELGIRLISWVWTRRLLDGWDEVQNLFEHNELARMQIWWHQTWLSGFRSRGSSANNYVIAEAAGQLAAAFAAVGCIKPSPARLVWALIIDASPASRNAGRVGAVARSHEDGRRRIAEGRCPG